MANRRKSLRANKAWRALVAFAWAMLLVHNGQAEDGGREAPASGGADYAARAVRASTGGRVLDVQPLPPETGREAYEVRVLLQEGRVRRVRVDAVPELQD